MTADRERAFRDGLRSTPGIRFPDDDDDGIIESRYLRRTKRPNPLENIYVKI